MASGGRLEQAFVGGGRGSSGWGMGLWKRAVHERRSESAPRGGGRELCPGSLRLLHVWHSG